jgi:hypothetical protein
MEVKNLVRGTAQVITITELAVGDVVKMVEEGSYDAPKMKFGVVTDVLNNGEESVIELTFVGKSYATPAIESRIITHSNQSKFQIYPATPHAFRDHCKQCVGAMEEEIDKLRSAWEEKIKAYKSVSLLLESTGDKALRIPKFKLLEAGNVE